MDLKNIKLYYPIKWEAPSIRNNIATKYSLCPKMDYV